MPPPPVGHDAPDAPGAPHAEWPPDWLRGVLGVCVLRVLADGPTYGYAISLRLEQEGIGAVKGGTLYPLLSRYEAAGLVEAQWRAGEGGPGRKYYELTDAGRRELATEAARWARFADLTRDLVTAAPGTPFAGGPTTGTPPTGGPTAGTPKQEGT